MSNFETDIPQQGGETLDVRPMSVLILPLEKNHDVDIGVR